MPGFFLVRQTMSMILLPNFVSSLSPLSILSRSGVLHYFFAPFVGNHRTCVCRDCVTSAHSPLLPSPGKNTASGLFHSDHLVVGGIGGRCFFIDPPPPPSQTPGHKIFGFSIGEYLNIFYTRIRLTRPSIPAVALDQAEGAICYDRACVYDAA